MCAAQPESPRRKLRPKQHVYHCVRRRAWARDIPEQASQGQRMSLGRWGCGAGVVGRVRRLETRTAVAGALVLAGGSVGPLVATRQHGPGKEGRGADHQATGTTWRPARPGDRHDLATGTTSTSRGITTIRFGGCLRHHVLE